VTNASDIRQKFRIRVIHFISKKSKINMVEILQSLIQQFGQNAVVNNTDVPDQINNDVQSEVMSGIVSGLSEQATSQGGLSSLMGLFTDTGAAANSSNLMSNPIVSMISQSVIKNLMQRFNLSNSAASGVVDEMLPNVLSGLISKTNDPNESGIDMSGVMDMLSDGKTAGVDFGSIMGAASGAMADGKLDMSDLMNLASGGRGNKEKNSGGLGGLISGLFGK
jgi:hypothetical protein